ncbi:hypothetical protein F4778DRAFT_798225 [Xylariomycetidae sp. FL2044]|nr:hypothetical protein F4778DRAFT_798225 [Xylariomycetidae sp. FL2044]
MKFSILATVLPLLTRATPLDVPRSLMTIEERSFTDPLAHGNFGRAAGKIWKYHQVGDGLFTGVDPDEWDDSVHVKRGMLPTTSLDYARDDGSSDDDVELAARQSQTWTQACQYAIGCTLLAGWTLKEAIKSIPGTVSSPEKTQAVFQALFDKAKSAGKTTLKSFDRPFFANMLGVGAQNVIVTAWTSTSGKSDDGGDAAAGKCTEASSEEATMIQMMRGACEEKGDLSSFTTTLKMHGVTFELNMAMAPGESIPDSAYCKKQS